MVAFAVERCALDPTFPGFVEWAGRLALPLTIVSDGFGFYVRPILEAAGLGRLPVLTNDLVFDGGARMLRHPNGHPECVGCGTCKMLATLRARERYGAIAFVGEGRSDRYGAIHSDVVFAKNELVAICERDGVSFQVWDTFDDVRRALESMPRPPDLATPDVCPGWTPT